MYINRLTKCLVDQLIKLHCILINSLYFIILLCLKAVFQSSHEAPHSSLRVLASN